MKRAAFLPIFFVAAACGASATSTEPTNEAGTSPPAADKESGNEVAANAADAPAHAPPPFTADELRDGLPAGTELRLRIETDGQPTVVQHWVFTTADESGCTIAARILADDGALLRDEGEGTSTWRELESHAHFPAARTTRRETEITVPAGTFAAWLYEVEPAKAGAPRQRYYFAQALPGPPVLFETVQGDSVIMRMALLSRTDPGK